MDRDELIAQYAGGPQEVLDAVDGITEAELDHRPAPDAWTAREVVLHLGDSETMSSIRLRKLLAEDDPVIAAYDEAAWAQRLRYAGRPIEPALTLLQAVRAANLELLRGLPEEAFARTGTHTESGPYSVSTWLEIYADHAHAHADQIRRARKGEA